MIQLGVVVVIQRLMHLEVHLRYHGCVMGEETSLLQGNCVIHVIVLSVSVRVIESCDNLCVDEPRLRQNINLCVIRGAVCVSVAEIISCKVAIVHNKVRCNSVGIDSRIVLYLDLRDIWTVPIISEAVLHRFEGRELIN